MDQYSLGDEGTLPPEMHLPSFPESQGLNCSDSLDQDLGPSAQELLYAGLSGLGLDPGLPAPDVPGEALEDNLDSLSLYSGKDSDAVKLLEEYADPEPQASLQGKAIPLGPRAWKPLWKFLRPAGGGGGGEFCTDWIRKLPRVNSEQGTVTFFFFLTWELFPTP